MYEHWTAPTPRLLLLEWYADAGRAVKDTINERAIKYCFKNATFVINLTQKLLIILFLRLTEVIGLQIKISTLEAE